MLKDAPGGLCTDDLRKYLDDPMSDPEVRQDEKTVMTTVENIKLLRNRLETTIDRRIGELDKELQVAQRTINERFGETFDEKFDKLLDVVEKINQGHEERGANIRS